MAQQKSIVAQTLMRLGHATENEMAPLDKGGLPVIDLSGQL